MTNLISRISAWGILFLVLAGAIAAQAQSASKTKTKPDFSGSWVLDLNQSDKKRIPSKPEIPIKISHQDPEFRITHTSTVNGITVERESVYYTDERGETNQTSALLTTNPGTQNYLDKQKSKSRTRWSGDKIITASTVRSRAATSVIEYQLVDEWKLSKDGQVLTRLTRVNFQGSKAILVPAIVPDTKKVYKRT